MNQEQITDLIGRINRSNGNGFSYVELRDLEATIDQLFFVRVKAREAYANQKDRLNKSEAQLAAAQDTIARLERINRDHQDKISEFYNANQEFTEAGSRLNENLTISTRIIAELRAQVTNHLAKIHEQEVAIQDLKARQWRVDVAPCSRVTATEITATEIKAMSEDLEELRSRNKAQMITISKFQHDDASLRSDLASLREKEGNTELLRSSVGLLEQRNAELHSRLQQARNGLLSILGEK